MSNNSACEAPFRSLSTFNEISAIHQSMISILHRYDNTVLWVALYIHQILSIVKQMRLTSFFHDTAQSLRANAVKRYYFCLSNQFLETRNKKQMTDKGNEIPVQLFEINQP
jgi:hypothetical protein